MTAEATWEEEYLVMMLAKDGRIVTASGSKLHQVTGLGEMMMEQKQIIAFDVFQTSPTRMFVPRRNSLH